MQQAIREKIAENKAALPGLHEKALDLGLFPQPWWNRAFYDYAIRQAEIVQEANGRR